MANILVLGAGTWGTVISNLLANNGNNVTCWSRNEKLISILSNKSIHDKLPGVVINHDIVFTSDFEDSFDNKEIIIFAVPSIAFREIVNKSIGFINSNHYLVSLTKGMEDGTLYTMSEIIEDELKKSNILNTRIAALSGPTHAEEVGRNMASMIVSASKDMNVAKYIQDIFMNENFRVYTNTDIKGVEICAAFKNVIAIASGIITGIGFGDNMKAAVITRGLAEMIRVGDIFGCKKDTFYGLAGVGDMIATATSTNSRNYNFGKLLGEGKSITESKNKIGMVVEGVNFLPKAIEIKNKYNIDLPITKGVYDIVFNNKNAKEIATLLMTRSKKAE